MLLFLRSSQGSEKHFAIFQVPFFIIFQKQPPEVVYKKAVHKYFAIFTGKHLCWSLFIKVADLKTPTHVFSCEYRNIHRKTPVLKSLFNKVAGLKACNFIKKRLQRRRFPANIAKFLRTAILKNINERMPLNLNKNFNQILHE